MVSNRALDTNSFEVAIWIVMVGVFLWMRLASGKTKSDHSKKGNFIVCIISRWILEWIMFYPSVSELESIYISNTITLLVRNPTSYYFDRIKNIACDFHLLYLSLTYVIISGCCNGHFVNLYLLLSGIAIKKENFVF